MKIRTKTQLTIYFLFLGMYLMLLPSSFLFVIALKNIVGIHTLFKLTMCIAFFWIVSLATLFVYLLLSKIRGSKNTSRSEVAARSLSTQILSLGLTLVCQHLVSKFSSEDGKKN